MLTWNFHWWDDVFRPPFRPGETSKYVDRIFDEYKFYSGVDHFHGRAAEIGPGDLSGVGLRLLADGCDHVDLADRFKSKSDPAVQEAVNKEIVSKYPGANVAKLFRHYGESAAAETFFRANKGYDFIFSCAVLEHVYDPVGALQAMHAGVESWRHYGSHGGLSRSWPVF